MKNIVVVGGGTAGWMTALVAKKAFKNDIVTLIESEELGILGAGEGTTPQFIDLMNWLKIPIQDFIKNTGTTFKHGGKFTNWLGDGTHYWHNFGSYDSDLGGDAPASYDHNFNHNNLYYHTAVVNNEDKLKIDVAALLCEEYKTPFIKKEKIRNIYETFGPFAQISPVAIHFDAVKVAKFLKNIGTQRGIINIEGKVIKAENNESGNISEIILDNDKKIKVDFVFDCSGFYKVLINKHFKVKDKKVNDKLTVNSAQPFFLLPPPKDKVPPYTEAVAMKYGWIWKIPLQHRFGCGYVYDNNYINKEEAKKEIIEYLGFEPEFGGHFSFNAGYVETPWVKNCIAVGVSSGFLEPLEASSIWTSEYFLENIFSDPAQLFLDDQRIRDDFNLRFCKWWEKIIDIVYLHYMGDRTDTEFWKHFQKIENAPTFVQQTLKKWEYSLPRRNDFFDETGDRPWQLSNWFEVAFGVNKINIDRIAKSVKNNGWDSYWPYYQNRKAYQREIVSNAVDHGEVLKFFGGFN